MTDVSLDLDEFKQAWQRLDRRLAAQQALAFQAFRDGRVRSLRRRLWPLYGGQIVQMLLALAFIVTGVFGWSRHGNLPHLVVAGVIMHAYGIALGIAAGRTIALMHRVDYAAPVVSIQRQLADLRAWHVRTGRWLGQAWWLLWMPCLMVAAAAVGADLWRRAPGVFGFGAAIGVIGLLLTEGAARLSRQPGWTWLAALNDDAMAGASLRRAQAVLDEIRRFEHDDTTPPDRADECQR
ncbi:MAG: serine/threonine protein kinase [Acidobacteria bacterium]|nr:serine/threonine protein kinase [Acidobacteriota bacterium]